ncbi:TolC family protein [Scytonema millei]|uniref:TolC family protein n=1 Tax=Scytonema millei VB511283 TaxID=1245923 RepID=A0A9X5I6W5_9CYAN|nr:TolC family protein [Scytonema millei]NHC37500.1 TolC family protein [Scytonema millei VB511283]
MKQQHLFLVRNFCSSLAVALLATELIKIEPAPAIASETPSVDNAIAMKSEPSKTQSIKATKQAYLQANGSFHHSQASVLLSNQEIGSRESGVGSRGKRAEEQRGRGVEEHQPSSRHVAPASTVNRQPSTINRQPSTVNHQPSTINRQLPTTVSQQPTTKPKPAQPPANSQLNDRKAQIPSYLNPNPNPLRFPTKPEEVQVVGAQPITFQQALDLAQRNSTQLREARLNVERSQAQLRQALAAEYPRLDLGAGVTNTGRYLFSEEPEPSFFQPDIDNSDTDVSGNLSLSYDLFTSGLRPANIRAAEEQLRFNRLDLERTQEELRLNVANDYYELQRADEQVRIQRSSVNNAQASLRDAQALEQAGVGTRFAVLQAQVQLAQATQRLTDALSQQRIARRQIATRINLNDSIVVTAADPVGVAGQWNFSLEDSIVLAFRNRAELEQQLAQRNISEQQRRAALAELGPRISLAAEYNLSDTFDDGTNFEDGYSLGGRLNLSLFDGGAARARARQEEADIAIAETNFAGQRNQIRFEVEQAFSQLQSNLENIQTTSVALEQSREALRLARLRFQAGVGTQTEVIDAEDDLTQAEGDRVNAILNYNRALAQIQRSISSGQQR